MSKRGLGRGLFSFIKSIYYGIIPSIPQRQHHLRLLRQPLPSAPKPDHLRQNHRRFRSCPTQILMPNPRADAADYQGGLKLTGPEFQAVREDLTVGGRRFLLKQGTASVACALDLGGLDDLVAVLSARAGTVRLMERLIAEHGAAPEAWLPQFRRQWRSALT